MSEEKDQNNKNNEGEVVIEADENIDDSVVAEENALETIKKLRLKLKEAEKKTAEYLTGWQRAQADFVNYKKREAEEKKEFLKFAVEPFALGVIEVLDSFDVAMANKIEWEKADKNWREGVERIYGQLISVLKKNGVESEEPVGKIFDPMNHLAIKTVPVEKKEEDSKIVSVLQKGYTLNGRVIRPAKVIVGQINNQ